MKKIKFLFSAVGHPTSPGMISVLKSNGERTIEVIGTDSNPENVVKNLFDKFFKVPKFDNPKFIEKILNICKSESIDVYYPRREEEAFLTCEREEDFKKNGVKLIRPSSKSVLDIICNKLNFHEYFKKNNIQHSKFRKITTVKNLEQEIYDLGYPEKKVILKPCFSTGGRGALTIAENISYSHNKKWGEVPEFDIETVLKQFSNFNHDKFPQIFLSEFLTGESYSVDVLSKNGEAYYIIPKTRLIGNPSNTVIGQINLNKDVIELARKVCKLFNFNFLQNYEMKFNEKNQPIIYDINPRGGASIAFCSEAGANILYYAIKMAMDEEIPLNKKITNNIKMIRGYHEYYEKNG